MSGIVIDWLGGNCPVQAEGTFDGEEFYFRARGTQVTCDVGEWTWHGPEYEWPDAGWIMETTAMAFISEAYSAWKKRDSAYAKDTAKLRRDNDLRDREMQALYRAGQMRNEFGECDAEKFFMKEAAEAREDRNRSAE